MILSISHIIMEEFWSILLYGVVFDSFKFDICLVVCSDATVKTSVVLPCGVCS